jgi:hypothetical protein
MRYEFILYEEGRGWKSGLCVRPGSISVECLSIFVSGDGSKGSALTGIVRNADYSFRLLTYLMQTQKSSIQVQFLEHAVSALRGTPLLVPIQLNLTHLH